VARKREDVKYRKSPFNSRRLAKEALSRLLSRVRAPHVVLSFNNEGFFTAQEIEGLLKEWGFVVRLSRTHKRYIGAVIGIYNPRGEKVGTTSHTENTEFLFVATHSREVYEEFARFLERTVVQPSLF
jgi:adenine-specific DNA-methyltransferase